MWLPRRACGMVQDIETAACGYRPVSVAGKGGTFQWILGGFGAGGRNRTDMELPPRDFESRASTSFTTPAPDAANAYYVSHLRGFVQTFRLTARGLLLWYVAPGL